MSLRLFGCFALITALLVGENAASAQGFFPLTSLFGCPLEATSREKQAAPDDWSVVTLDHLGVEVMTHRDRRLSRDGDRADIVSHNGQIVVSIRRQRQPMPVDTRVAIVDLRQWEVGANLCNRDCLSRFEAQLMRFGWSEVSLSVSGRPLAESRRWLAATLADELGVLTVVISMRWSSMTYRDSLLATLRVLRSLRPKPQLAEAVGEGADDSTP